MNTLCVVATVMAAMAFADPMTHGGAWRAVLVTPEEPGERMVVSGTVYAEDGITPVGGVTVYVYHTDAEGYYRKGTQSPNDPRLRGTMITNGEGKYEYRTIKPAPYPGGRNPAHVHYVLSGNGYARQYDDLQFEGDPFLSESDVERSRSRGTFGDIQRLVKDAGGILRCVKDVRLKQ